MQRLAAVWFSPQALLFQLLLPALLCAPILDASQPGLAVLSRSWHFYLEQAGDDVIGVDTINQPFPVVVDKPADDLCADAGILPVVFLGASGRKETDTVTQGGQDGC